MGAIQVIECLLCIRPCCLDALWNLITVLFVDLSPPYIPKRQPGSERARKLFHHMVYGIGDPNPLVPTPLLSTPLPLPLTPMHSLQGEHRLLCLPKCVLEHHLQNDDSWINYFKGFRVFLKKQDDAILGLLGQHSSLSH